MNTQLNYLSRVAIRGIAIAFTLAGISAHALTVRVNVENVSQPDGLWFTPVFFGFHDGSYDTFDSGLSAPDSIEALAEGGDASGLVSSISNVSGSKSRVLLQDGSGAPPGVLFAPGESQSFTIELDPSLNRYLSFATMLVPSNDIFFGNPSPSQFELFSIFGEFQDGFEINLFGSDIWDAGTEENDFLGAPLSALGGISTDTTGSSISLLGQEGLDNFSGRSLATGTNLSNNLFAGDQIARISVEQVPDSTQYIGFLGAFAIVGFRILSRKRMGRESS
ncbi:spondin domain-containing protein [Pelagicoccus sp. SDUM812002]|uniref:spondin domain-containing protein n=1 Tax=Pelagicoccus sp. SDUM812002 TaxID=3041266 RepID=UPI0028103DD5|nr:spondin domain-containing protein [Pelagicoccus sp. SDUM812002]MDQ8184574.1 spondin domain-containing protein [Pelagicoccus sp. SDUM812002]